MAFQIECAIQEVEFDVEKIVSLKIKGTEGYLLKQGGAEFNVFCPVLENGERLCGKTAKIFDVKELLCCGNDSKEKHCSVILQAKLVNAKVRLKFESINSKDADSGNKIFASLTSATLI